MEQRENEPATLPSVEVVKNEWKKHNVIALLQREDLNLDLDEDDIGIIRNKKVSGKDFLGLTAEKLEDYGLESGPASRIAELVKEIKGEQEQPGAASVENLASLFGQLNVSGSSSTSVSPLTMLASAVNTNSEVMKQTSEIMKKVLIRFEKEDHDTGSVTRARAYQNIVFEKASPEYFFSKMNGTYLGNFQNGGTVNNYLRDYAAPTATEEEVQNWFVDLMLELPSFNKRLVVEDTHKSPYLNGFMPDLSVFLEDDVRDRTFIPMFVQTLLEVKKKKSDSGFADEDKGQLIDYMNVLIQHQPLREHFALFLSDGFRFYVMVYERNTRQYREYTTNFKTGLRLFWVLLRYDSSYTKMAGPRNIKFYTAPRRYINLHLTEFLGLGSSSTVYKVDYNDTQAALKYSQSVDPFREAQILQFLNKNNIPNIPNYIAHDNQSIIISPVCKRISRNRFRSYHALQLLHLLRRIHSINVFHRDVRPENILLDTGNDSLILADWGAAIHNPDEHVPYEGTISFASPDILNNNLGSHQPRATDDLHSFVRSMYILHNPLKMPTINPNETLASKAQVIREFWGDNVNVKLGGVLWEEMVNAANNGDYSTLEKCCYIFKS